MHSKTFTRGWCAMAVLASTAAGVHFVKTNSYGIVDSSAVEANQQHVDMLLESFPAFNGHLFEMRTSIALMNASVAHMDAYLDA
jgi:hypothetical protein